MTQKIAVIIPCYRVRAKVLQVIEQIPDVVSLIIAVDDACPEGSGHYILEHVSDPRVQVIFNQQNQGVGGAIVAGFRVILEKDIDIVVKIDGDGQMDPALIPMFVAPLADQSADYTKGNRFSSPEDVRAMPPVRLFGNAILSFFTKISSGYWDIFDPTNGYVAIHRTALKRLPLDKLEKRFFFESDLLFRLNTIGAVVEDIPMRAIYDDEESNLKIHRILLPFLAKHMRNFFKRIVYNYFLRDVSLASLELVIGTAMMVFGLTYGLCKWHQSLVTGVEASAGTVMLAALPTLAGIQLILSFINYDILRVPRRPLQRRADVL